MKIIDAVNFIRSKGVLKNWSNGQIAIGILNAIKQSAITWTTDLEGNINGICFGEWQDDATTFNVTLLAGESSPRVFFRYLKETFPQCKKVKFGRLKYLGKPREFKLI